MGWHTYVWARGTVRGQEVIFDGHRIVLLAQFLSRT
jgi:hypothetical protein